MKHCSLILSCFFLNVFLTSRNESRIFQSFYLTEAVSPGGLVTNPVVFCMVPPILNNNFTGVVVFAERMRDELPMFHLNSRFRPPLISLCSGSHSAAVPFVTCRFRQPSDRTNHTLNTSDVFNRRLFKNLTSFILLVYSLDL